MAPKARKKAPEIILRNGKPAAVILDIEAYQEMLERLEDIEDLKMLAEMRNRPLKFKKLDDFLQKGSISLRSEMIVGRTKRKTCI